MIPTAIQFMEQREAKDNCLYPTFNHMIEFAKLHVTEALKAAHRNMQAPEEDIEFTLDAYPLEEIK